MQAISQQLANARTKLAAIAGTNAALEARLLAAHAWGMSHESLLLRGNDMQDVTTLTALIDRRLTAEPVAQIVGRKGFWKDDFIVSRHVLTPRADSETMIETLLRQRVDLDAPYRMLDLGTGSGCLILSALREYHNATAVAVDASEMALNIAARNAAALSMGDRCEMLHSNWCENLNGRFDIIISNPPYIPTVEIGTLSADVRVHEPIRALDGGEDGLDDYRRIMKQLAAHAKPGSLLLFEVGMGQADDVAAIATEAGWAAIELAKDFAGIARVVALEFNINTTN